jgi:hypothetical protein
MICITRQIRCVHFSKFYRTNISLKDAKLSNLTRQFSKRNLGKI